MGLLLKIILVPKMFLKYKWPPSPQNKHSLPHRGHVILVYHNYQVNPPNPTQENARSFFHNNHLARCLRHVITTHQKCPCDCHHFHSTRSQHCMVPQIKWFTMTTSGKWAWCLALLGTPRWFRVYLENVLEILKLHQDVDILVLNTHSFENIIFLMNLFGTQITIENCFY